jgi:hypothetical protein
MEIGPEIGYVFLLIFILMYANALFLRFCYKKFLKSSYNTSKNYLTNIRVLQQEYTT